MQTKKKLVYLDNAATTKPHPKVVEAMVKYLIEEYGNPSSTHTLGSRARNAVEEAREIIAQEINASAGEIYFTSGGTEANNFVLKGFTSAAAKETMKRGIVSLETEHHAVLDTIEDIANKGFNFVKTIINHNGEIDIRNLRGLLDDDILLISVMHINNEIGVINDLEQINTIAKSKNIFTHSDCVQSFGKYSIDVKKLKTDMICASAHKINGPKGTGFAYIKSGTPAEALILGGSQERNRRGGTENVAGIIGLAEAIKIYNECRTDYLNHVKNIKSRFINALKSFEGIYFNGGTNTTDYICSVTFDPEIYKVDTESILVYLDINGVAASSGSACMSGSLKPSHVIKALGKSDDYAKGTVRFSFDFNTTEDDIDYAIGIINNLLKQIKK